MHDEHEHPVHDEHEFDAQHDQFGHNDLIQPDVQHVVHEVQFGHNDLNQPVVQHDVQFGQNDLNQHDEEQHGVLFADRHGFQLSDHQVGEVPGGAASSSTGRPGPRPNEAEPGCASDGVLASIRADIASYRSKRSGQS